MAIGHWFVAGGHWPKQLAIAGYKKSSMIAMSAGGALYGEEWMGHEHAGGAAPLGYPYIGERRGGGMAPPR